MSRIQGSLRRSGLALGWGLAASWLLPSCVLMDFASVKIMYHRALLEEKQIHRDLPYRQGPGADLKKHRLDLYVPSTPNWPILIFAHGGGWNTGDKSFEVGGADIYANIGRFYASRGVGVAVINYRLLPAVSWRDQVADVAAATAWVHRNAARFGGDPRRLTLSGHSAGAQLAARVALDPEPLRREGLAKTIVKGVIAASGAGYEITVEEEETAIRASPPSDPGQWKSRYFEKRFAEGDKTGAWAREVSILRFVDRSAPPFLVLYGTAEPLSLIRQSRLLADRLEDKGRTLVIPHRDHVQTVMVLSRDGTASEAIRDFVVKTRY